MTATDLVTLIDSAERQLKVALKEAESGQQVDLGGLVPWLDRLCATALEQHAGYAAPGLAVLTRRLDALGEMLQERLTSLNDLSKSTDPAAVIVVERPPRKGQAAE